MKRRVLSLISFLLILCLVFVGCNLTDTPPTTQSGGGGSTTGNPTTDATPGGDDGPEIPQAPAINLSNIPAYSNKAYVAINGNVPYFTEEQYTTTSYESYSKLDSLGRCGVAIACVGIDLMPTTDRGDISSVKPTGWHSVEYSNISGGYLYNRCHLIGFQLSGENANSRNLITGTRYLNISGMLPFENMIADYVKDTENHVLFRVTPIFEGNNLVASGVLMEAYSIEDDGDGICFNVYCYNVQPGITINYATGASSQSSSTPSTPSTGGTYTYTLNTSTKKFHYPDCSSASKIADKNKDTYTGTRDGIIAQGYSPCGNCDP